MRRRNGQPRGGLAAARVRSWRAGVALVVFWGWLLVLVGWLGVPASASVPASAPATPRVSARIGLCVIEAPPEAERALVSLSERARTILPTLEADLGTRPLGRYRIWLITPSAAAGSDSEMARLDAGAPPWAAGYMIPEARLGAIRLAQANQYPYGTVESVFAHEVTHLLIHDATRGNLPRWFDEGLATLQGRKWSLEDAMVYSSSLLTSDLPPLAGLDSAFSASADEARLAYAGSFSFVSRAARRYGPRFVPTLLREAAHRPFARAWLAAAGRELYRDEAEWRRESLVRFRWIPIITASSTFWIGISLLAAAAGAKRRARAKQAREQLPDPEDWEEPTPEDEESTGDPPQQPA